MEKTTAELIDLVNEQMKSLSLPAEPERLYAPIEYILNHSGKRLRPLLFLHAIQLFSKLTNNHLLPAAGMEIFHNFTLIHDDIMDKADIRRNQPTIHKKWDENVAILSGDAAMILSTKYFLGLPEDILRPVLNEFNKMALEICEGQQYDMDFEIRDNVTIDEYLEMIRLKTAVFLASALKMGAIVGNAPVEQQQLLYDAGINFGLAFQLQDDFLDTFGSLETFGKQPGGDILEKKKTYLLITALKNANPDKQTQLIDLMNNENLPAEKKIESIKSLYKQLSVDTVTQEAIVQYYTKGFSLLKKVTGNHIVKNELQQLFQKLIKRIY